jgi:hypothetical protein
MVIFDVYRKRQAIEKFQLLQDYFQLNTDKTFGQKEFVNFLEFRVKIFVLRQNQSRETR